MPWNNPAAANLGMSAGVAAGGGGSGGGVTAGPSNTSAGTGSGALLSTGLRNTLYGVNAGAAIQTANDVAAFGYDAMAAANVTGTAFGSGALALNTTGAWNTAVGHGALGANLTGGENTAVGRNALLVATGNGNTAVGVNTLDSCTTGGYNTALGSRAMEGLVTGDQNIALGMQAMDLTTGGMTGAIAIGYRAARSTTTGTTALGFQALTLLTTGQRNTGVGSNALASITTQLDCTAVGHSSLAANTGSQNTAVGSLCLDANSTGTNNTAIGAGALGSNTTGDDNSACGYGSLGLTTGAGSSNSALGYNAGSVNTTGIGNVFLGKAAGDGTAATASNRLIGGSSSFPINDVYFGKGETNFTPTTWTLHGTNRSAVSNATGGDLNIAGGQGTGTALGGSISFQTSGAGASSSALNALTTRLTIDGAGYVHIGGASTAAAFSYNLDVTCGGTTASARFGPSATDAGAYINCSGNSEAMFTAGAIYKSWAAGVYTMTGKGSTASGYAALNGTLYLWSQGATTAGVDFSLPLTNFAMTSTTLTIGLPTTISSSGAPITATRSDNTSASLGIIAMQRGSGAGTRAAISTTGDTTNGVASLQFEVGGSNRLTISAAGAVAIPVTLDVTGAITGSDSVRAYKNGADGIGSGANFYLANAANTRAYVAQLSASNHLDFWSYDGTTWSTRARLTAGGALLIGTTTDDGVNKLQVAGSATIGGTTAAGSLNITTTSNGTARHVTFIDTANLKYNWRHGAQLTINDAYEIIPSTAVGGSTFTGPVLSIAPDGLTSLTRTSASTSSTFSGLSIFHRSTGVAAGGFGAAVNIFLETSTTNDQNAGNWNVLWADATHASRKARCTFEAMDSAGAREFLRGEASGTAPMIGFLGAAATARTAITGSRGGNAALAALLTELATKGLITDSSTA